VAIFLATMINVLPTTGRPLSASTLILKRINHALVFTEFMKYRTEAQQPTYMMINSSENISRFSNASWVQ